MSHDEESDALESSFTILLTAGPWSYGRDHDLPKVANEWATSGLNPQEIHDWINTAGVFYAHVAVKLRQSGLDPVQAGCDPKTLKKSKTRQGAIGYLVSQKKLTVEEATNLTLPLRLRQKF